jgi:hypothetical protein
MAMPADQIPVGEGVGPDGRSPVEFFVDKPMLNRLIDHGPTWKLDDARFIEETIRRPDAIFEGLKRDNHEESLCYSVRVTRDPDSEESSTPPRFGFVFVIFIVRRFGLVVFDWEWRAEDFDNPGHPENWKNDFSRLLWSKS